jgi:hypothetical protein
MNRIKLAIDYTLFIYLLFYLLTNTQEKNE